MGLDFNLAADLQALVGGLFIDRPFGQPRAVGISGSGKADPVGAHVFGNLSIDFRKGIIGPDIMSKGEPDFRAMKGPKVIKTPGSAMGKLVQEGFGRNLFHGPGRSPGRSGPDHIGGETVQGRLKIRFLDRA